jgi:neutral ceramidase
MKRFIALALVTVPFMASACASEAPEDAESISSEITLCEADSDFRVGSGIYDITGPAKGLGMMGYAMLGQKTEGIHTRLWSRAHVIESGCSKKRVVFVSADLQGIPQTVKQDVVRQLQTRFGQRYSEANVLLSATHTHSGPGGFSVYALYDLTTLGFNLQNYQAIVQGITESIVRADQSVAKASIRTAEVETTTRVGVNRSARAYALNPQSERNRYTGNTNPLMTLLTFERPDGTSPGLINWFAVHGTSMSNRNRLISSDNKGRAAQLLERTNGKNLNVPGTFVASFAQSDEGDVSPTDPLASNADGHADFVNTQASGDLQLRLAQEAKSRARPARGTVDFVHGYVKFDAVQVAPEFSGGAAQKTCAAALGLSMIAGTEDGRGYGSEGQSCNETKQSLLTDLVCAVSHTACQGEKPIALTTGNKSPVPWTPDVLPLQILRVADTAIVAVPFELTTMSGRRVRAQVQSDLTGTGVSHVVIAGLSNAYSGYVATREEYAQQDYEGASTHFGPYQLAAIQQELHRLALAMRTGRKPESGPTPRFLNISAQVQNDVRPREDTALMGRQFGHVISQTELSYRRGTTARVSFVAAHPARDLKTMSSYLYVERKTPNGWEHVYSDDDPETKIRFAEQGQGCNPFATCYEATVEWSIQANTAPGTYRVRYFGSALVDEKQTEHQGASREFLVQ